MTPLESATDPRLGAEPTGLPGTTDQNDRHWRTHRHKQLEDTQPQYHRPRPSSLPSDHFSAKSQRGSRRLRRHTVTTEPAAQSAPDMDVVDEEGEHAVSTPNNLALGDLGPAKTNKTGSGDSSDSTSTITPSSFSRRRADTGDDSDLPLRHHPSNKPDVLSFLNPDSPAVTRLSIQRSLNDASKWLPRHASEPAGLSGLSAASISPTNRSPGSSSGSSSDRSDTSSQVNAGHFDDLETDPSTSPEQSENGDLPDKTGPHVVPAQQTHRTASYKYGTPEMPRGTANLPHRRGNALTPRAPNHAKHLPRAEKLPLTGYELLASRLSARPRSQGHTRHRSSSSISSLFSDRSDRGPCSGDATRLRPVYRRFESLNHRILLQLQDELAELEEQLHRLDTADTQNRRLRDSILPASRRNEYLAGGELQWHRTDILSKIGYKLGQYNHALTSFKEAHALPSPSRADVADYRAYLSAHNPITEPELRFLDPVDDLVCLAADMDDSNSSTISSLLSPSMPGHNAAASLRQPPSFLSPCLGGSFAAGSSRGNAAPSANASRSASVDSKSRRGSVEDGDLPASPVLQLALAISVAVLVPVLAFAAVPSFAGRMAVVLLVALTVSGAQAQSGILDRATSDERARGDVMLCAGVYGAVMVVVASVV